MIKNPKTNQLLSILIILTLLCFTFLSTLQVSSKIDGAVSFQFNVINSAKSFMRTYILYPYLSVFVEANNFVRDRQVFANVSAGNKRSVPVRKKSRNKIFQQIYYILSAVLITNKNVLSFLSIAFVCISLGFKKRFNIGYKRNQILIKIKFHTNWVLKFINPCKKLLRILYDRDDIGHIVKEIMEKTTRILDKIFGVRVVFMNKESFKKAVIQL